MHTELLSVEYKINMPIEHPYGKKHIFGDTLELQILSEI